MSFAARPGPAPAGLFCVTWERMREEQAIDPDEFFNVTHPI